MRIERSALVPYSDEVVFSVVNDVESYPKFLPWCRGCEVISRDSTEIVARLDLAGAGVSQSFTTRNLLCPPKSIHLSLVDGPFAQLEGEWHFTRLDAAACKIEMTLSFSVDNSVLSLAVGKVFEAAADKMVDAFCSRVDVLHG